MAADEQGREELHDEAPIEDVEGHKRGWHVEDSAEETDDVEGHKRSWH